MVGADKCKVAAKHLPLLGALGRPGRLLFVLRGGGGRLQFTVLIDLFPGESICSSHTIALRNNRAVRYFAGALIRGHKPQYLPRAHTAAAAVEGVRVLSHTTHISVGGHVLTRALTYPVQRSSPMIAGCKRFM